MPERRGEVRLGFEVDRLSVSTESKWPTHDSGIVLTIGTESVELTYREAAKLARWITDALAVVNYV